MCVEEIDRKEQRYETEESDRKIRWISTAITQNMETRAREERGTEGDEKEKKRGETDKKNKDQDTEKERQNGSRDSQGTTEWIERESSSNEKDLGRNGSRDR